MQTFEEYKERYVTFYGIFNDELLKLAYLIDCQLEEAKGTVGSAILGVGYWIAEKLIQEGYRDTKWLAAVLKEATDEAIKRVNEDLVDAGYRKASEVMKETAKEFFNKVDEIISWCITNDNGEDFDYEYFINCLRNLKKEFGVEVE